MIEILITVVLEVAKCLAPPLGCRFVHLRNYKVNFDNLQQEVGELKFAKDRVQRKIDEAENNIEEIDREVKEWQSNVESVIDEAEKLIEDKANNRCFKGLCPNLRKRHKNSKEASRKLEVIGRLLLKEGSFDKVSYRIIPEDIRLKPTEDFEAFESRDKILENIIKALNDGSEQMVGIYGMGGIGKTTLVKEVGMRAKNDKLFDKVVFVETSENPNIKKIQEEIAGALGLKDLCSEDLESQRANMLYARLKNEKRILLILDNIWGELHLQTIGIPAGSDHGCKLLVTTRNRDLLATMGSEAFQIGRLGEDEAWKLFKKMSGDYIENRELKSVAVDVVKECGGLPLAIVTVAKALREKNKFEWDDALEELKRPSPSNISPLLKPAYSAIELSYNKLEGDELKKTFLLCSLLTDCAEIPVLFGYVMGLDMLDGKTFRLEQARNKVKKWVRQLKDSCLLIGYGYGANFRFSMHDVVRHVALSIACRDQHAFTVRNDDLREWPDKDKLKHCMKISIHGGNIVEPLGRLECPELEFFYMTYNNNSWRIPENFFFGMAKLRVLHLSKLSSLPSSLCDLVNLQTLYLDYGNFKDVAIIGELKKLKILSLFCSHIEQLPSEIGQLAQTEVVRFKLLLSSESYRI